MLYHAIAFCVGYILDLLIGDPHNMPHPIRLIGGLISTLEKKLLKEEYSDKKKRKRGIIFVLAVLLITTLVTSIILVGSYLINDICGVVVESIMTYFILATKSLKDESMKVYYELDKNDIESARYMLSMIVGRDTKVLDEEGIIKAAVETVAENSSDGVIAPMIYTAIGGPILGYFYKAVNTMDSMVGYKNDKYMYFGTCAAKLDDVVNFLPARISAILMIIATYILQLFNAVVSRDKRIYNGRMAAKIFARDHYNHKSPNSAQTESVCAGALGIRLAGPASYFGKMVEKPYIGDAQRVIEKKDIKRANVLLYMTAFLGAFLSAVLLFLIL